MPPGPSNLPVPGNAARAQSENLAARIRTAIESAGGALPFSEYMRLALYAPGLGYYRAGTEKFGAAGDFVTAPEVSPLFGKTVARQIGASLAACGGNSVLELGAGSGRMARDMLRTLAAQDRLPKHYFILEVSAELAARQRELLATEPELATRVTWLKSLPEKPLEGVIVANEVADALPVECFRYTGGSVHRRGVRSDKNGFQWCDLEADEALSQRVRAWAQRYRWSGTYASEFSPELRPWVRALAGALERGLILLLDYGLPEREYYHPQRDTGTLVCHHRHRAHADPFVWPGLCDISAWVDFTALARAGGKAGLEVGGYATQANFLAGGGIADAVAQAQNERERLRLAGEVKRLVLPTEMGEAFKAIALTRDCPPPPAFDFHNAAARL